MFKGLILATFAMSGLLSTMSAISSDEVTKPSDLNATMHVENIVLGSGCFWALPCLNTKQTAANLTLKGQQTLD